MSYKEVAKAYIDLYFRTGDLKWLDEARNVLNEEKIAELGDFLTFEEAV